MHTPYIDAALLIWGYMTLLFFLSLIRRDNSIVDIAKKQSDRPFPLLEQDSLKASFARIAD